MFDQIYVPFVASIKSRNHLSSFLFNAAIFGQISWQERHLRRIQCLSDNLTPFRGAFSHRLVGLAIILRLRPFPDSVHSKVPFKAPSQRRGIFITTFIAVYLTKIMKRVQSNSGAQSAQKKKALLALLEDIFDGNGSDDLVR